VKESGSNTSPPCHSTQNTGGILPRKSIGNVMVCLAVMLVLVSGIHRGKRGHEVGLLVWAGKRTHPTDLTHAILKATPRGTGSVQQTSFQQEQLLMGSNGFKSRCDFLQTHNQILALVAKSLPSWAASVFTSEFTSFGDCQNCLLNWGRLWSSQPSSGRIPGFTGVSV
jgi:hypothetical protein